LPEGSVAIACPSIGLPLLSLGYVIVTLLAFVPCQLATARPHASYWVVAKRLPSSSVIPVSQ
jgi:hypothetical protein